MNDMKEKGKLIESPQQTGESAKCKSCGEPADWGGYCTDCWPGYNLCADPRCEHAGPEGKEDCGNAGCACKVFVEGSEKRVVTKKEWAEIRKEWEAKSPRQSSMDSGSGESPDTAIQGCLHAIRQIVKGRCNRLDLETIQDLINETIGQEPR